MTYDDVITMLEEAGLPLAYDHFAEGESPDPPSSFFYIRALTICSRMTRCSRKLMS